MAVAYTLYGAIALRYITVTYPEVAFFFLFALGVYGAGFVICSTYTVLAKNFPNNQRSAVVSIAKSWQGVAAGVATAIFVGWFPSGDKESERLKFLFFLAIVSGAAPILIAPILRPLEPTRVTERFLLPVEWRVPFGFSVSLILICVTLASAFHKTLVISIALLVIMVTPLAMILPKGSAGDVSPPTSSDTESLVEDSQDVPQDPPPELSPWAGGPGQIVQRPEFYLLWMCGFALQSGGLFLTTNLGTISDSRSGGHVSSTSAVTVFSCAQGT